MSKNKVYLVCEFSWDGYTVEKVTLDEDLAYKLVGELTDERGVHHHFDVREFDLEAYIDE